MEEPSPTRGKLEPFFPPRPSRPILWLAERLAPTVLRLVWRIHAVEVPPKDLERLRAVRTSSALVIANHPSLAEPMVMFQAMRRAGVSSYLLTAWDTMVRLGRLSVSVFQSIGAYSIRRGRRDRAAMETTETLLVQGERVLMFPEGQTYGLNDTLLPFQQGALLMGFHAAEELERTGQAAPVLVVPMAVKYIYLRPMLGQIQASLRRLERALGLKGEGQTFYSRLSGIATTLVERLEQEQGTTAAPGTDLNARIDALRARIIARLAEALGTQIPRGADFTSVVQMLANAYEDYLEKYEPSRTEAAGGTGAASIRSHYRLWLRLKNFVAMRDDYVSEWPSAERFVDVLTRLEIDVLGRSRIRGMRRALVRIGEPINLREHLSEYRKARRETLAALTHRLEGEVKRMLREAMEQTKPLPELREE